jgi:tryptophan synthase alpha chain
MPEPAPAATELATGPLETPLRAARDAGRKLLVPYVTGGFGDWLDVIRALADAGADAIEVGIPFSDPVMDGPTIQEASERALAAGATPAAILSKLREVDAGVPLVVMTYYNLVFRAGHERFAASLAEAGVAGIILPDVPMEEQGPWRAAADVNEIDTVLLAGPITPDDRLRAVCEQSRGFVYGVTLMGVTGERAALGAAAENLGRRLKAVTDKPVVMGFGVSGPEVAVTVAEHADGVVVASAIIRRLLEGASVDDVHRFVASLRSALDR